MVNNLELIDALLHVDEYLAIFIKQFGLWIYFILFFIIFSETGLVVTPFLPGDSLLFAIGAVAATGQISINIILPLLFLAAVLGNIANYFFGYFLGDKIFNKESNKFLNKSNLDKTNKFYEKHGGKAVIISRFIPFFRTFVPFVAGVGKMNYLHFISYNIIGAGAWVLSFIMVGYFFGNMPVVKDNFGLVIIGILLVSLLPTLVEYLKYKSKETKKDTQTDSA